MWLVYTLLLVGSFWSGYRLGERRHRSQLTALRTNIVKLGSSFNDVLAELYRYKAAVARYIESKPSEN